MKQLPQDRSTHDNWPVLPRLQAANQGRASPGQDRRVREQSRWLQHKEQLREESGTHGTCVPCSRRWDAARGCRAACPGRDWWSQSLRRLVPQRPPRRRPCPPCCRRAGPHMLPAAEGGPSRRRRAVPPRRAQRWTGPLRRDGAKGNRTDQGARHGGGGGDGRERLGEVGTGQEAERSSAGSPASGLAVGLRLGCARRCWRLPEQGSLPTGGSDCNPLSMLPRRTTVGSRLAAKVRQSYAFVSAAQ